MAARAPIAILTDFGYRDHYAGVLRGVIESIAPGAHVIDITHGIPPQSIVAGALALQQSWRFFPPRTIFLAVVDPGVGSARKPIAIATRAGARFVGPDNGVLSLAAEQAGIARIVELRSPRYRLAQTSTTFHGRDIFAPAAAHLSRGVRLATLGPPRKQIERIELAAPRATGRTLRGTIVYVDGFGNLVSNIDRETYQRFAASFRDRSILVRLRSGARFPIRRTYAEAPIGSPLAAFGSFGLLEVAIREGSAAERMKAAVGADVVIEPGNLQNPAMSSVGAQDSPILTGIPRHQPPSRSTGGLAREFRIPPINLALFVLTALTTTMAGALWNGASLDIDHPLLLVFGLGAGLSYSIPLLAILLFHELGHYVTARRNGVEASLPYFIPAPYPLFLIGTFGAFIRMKSAPRSRRVMFDVGAAGPWAGMLLAVPAVIIGLKLSDVLPLDQSAGGLELGNSLLFLGLARWVLGVDPNSVTVILHPIAFAGWLGLFVTSLNLLPVGQLDGGHVVYALFGRRHRLISRLFVASSVLMVIVPWAMGWGYWLGWLLWAVLLMFLGLGHPAALDAETPLDPRRRLYAWATVVLFIVTFSPVPLSFTAPRAIHNESQSYSVIHHAPAPRPLAHSI